MSTQDDVTHPTIAAFETRDPDGKNPQWVFWCPWCETVHRHGAVGGERVAHCHDESSALIKHGYSLQKAGEVESEAEIVPRRFRRGAFRTNVASVARDLRTAALRALLPLTVTRARQDCFVIDVCARARLVMFDEQWRVEDASGVLAEGNGLLRLAQPMYGVSPGVAGVRFLEALSGWPFDDEAARAIAVAIDAWSSRGGRARRGIA